MSHRLDIASRNLLEEGILGCTANDVQPQGTSAPVSGTIYACKYIALRSAPIGHLCLSVGTAATLLTTAVFDISEQTGAAAWTQLSLSADQSAVVNSIGDKQVVMPSFNQIEGHTYYVRALCIATTATPALSRFSLQRGINAPKTAAPGRVMTGPAAQTVLGTPWDATAYALGGFPFLFSVIA